MSEREAGVKSWSVLEEELLDEVFSAREGEGTSCWRKKKAEHGGGERGRDCEPGVRDRTHSGGG
jgi:hypothetical protein